MSKTTIANLSVYACGGAATNLMYGFTDIPDDPEREYYPKSSLHLIDTSTSNVRENVSGSDIKVTIVQGVEGAGKDRAKAYAAVAPEIDTFLTNHKPGDFNIVMFSLSGGSGSIIAPLITAALLRRKRPVVMIGIGSTTSATETKNTINTLKSLQNMAATTTGGKAIPIIYLENSDADNDYKGRRTEVDQRIAEIIRQLSLLFSGMHKELDKSDVANWLDYSKVAPSINPKLIEVMIFKGEDGLESLRGVAVTTASLLTSNDAVAPNLDQPYATVGYYNDKVIADGNMPNLHYILTASRLPEIMRALEERAEVYRLAHENMNGIGIDYEDTDSAGSDTGMVL